MLDGLTLMKMSFKRPQTTNNKHQTSNNTQLLMMIMMMMMMSIIISIPIFAESHSFFLSLLHYFFNPYLLPIFTIHNWT